MNLCWGNMGNEAVSYKPYGMLADQGMQQNQHKSNNKSNKSNKSNKGQNNGGHFLNEQVGMNVRINRGGPESLEGKLLGVQTGYLVLKASGGLVYVNSSHVRSVTDLPKGSGGSRGSNGSRGTGGTRTFIMANSFVGVLHQLTRKFVQVNWGGPEKIEGFIAQVGSEALLLVVGPELVQIPLYHIKTVKTAGIYASGGSRGDKSSSGGSKNSSSGSKNNSSGGSKNNSSGGNGNANNRNTSSKNSKTGKKSGKTSSTLRGKKG